MIPVIVEKIETYSFDFDRIKKDVLDIISTFNFPQIGLTHSPAVLGATVNEKVLESIGSIYDFENKNFKYKETDFSIFNDVFKNTSLYEMYQAIPNIGRFRIMTLNGPSCYTIHKDLSKRYHYVLETNTDCIFLFPTVKQQHHLPADKNLYLVDTRYRHTFVNGSRQRRIHLVLDDLSSLK